MKVSCHAWLFLLPINAICASFQTKRQTTDSFAGANNRFIHAVDTSHAQEQWALDLQNAGAKVVRLFLDPAYGCQQGSTTTDIPGLEQNGIGQFNDTILDAMDSLLGIIHSYGLKAIISPHNGNDLEATSGRDVCDTYCAEYGATGFYNNQTAIQQYDNRLAHILNYTSTAFNGRPWKSLSEVILGFDVQNEPFIAPSARATAGANNASTWWVCDRAATLKSLLALATDPPIQVLSGGIGGNDFPGNEYSFIPAAVDCPSMDVVAMHSFRHAGEYGDYVWFNATRQAALQANGKTVLMEEFGVGGNGIPSSDYDGITGTLDALGMPWLYWEYVPGGTDDPSKCPAGADKCCSDASSYDGYEIASGTQKPLSVDGSLTFGSRIAQAGTSALNATGMVFA